MASSAPGSPLTPRSKFVKPAYQPGVMSYGCEHIRVALHSKNSLFIKNYKNALSIICNNSPIRSHVNKDRDRLVAHIISCFMCMQCESCMPQEKMEEHSKEKKHRYCTFVDSRTGSMFCNMCRDFVFDPTLESHRINKMETGTFSNPRKRKPDEHVDLFQETDIKEASKQNCNTTSVRGMWNMGSTCYMTVILESLVHNPLMRNFYLGEGHKSATCPRTLAGESCLSCNMDEMFQQFNNTESTTAFSAQNILGSFMSSTKPAYAGLVPNEQQDAHEFLNYLREELHEINATDPRALTSSSSPVKRTKYDQDDCKCVIHQTFYGRTINIIKCKGERNGKKCNAVRRTSPQSFADLSLGLDNYSSKKPQTLQYWLQKEYFVEEKLEIDCASCGSNQATKQVSIKTLPNVLCIQLKRSIQRDSGPVKIKKKVHFPMKLEMLPYTDRANEAKGHGGTQYALKNRSTYHLQSVVHHDSATSEQGHYISYSKHEGQWFKFDDHKVYLASKSEVLNVEAYILFYVIQSVSSVDEQN